MSEDSIVVLGVTGMLGHKVFQRCGSCFPNVLGVSRDLVSSQRFRNVTLLQTPNVLQGFDATCWSELERLLRRLRPRYIVNCIGIIKQRDEAKQPIPSLLINSLLPHRLANAAADWGGRIIHFSTDCVFSGKRGNYREEDISDAEDLYGRSKYMGEVAAPNALTLRTSIIGRELAGFRGLLEWFLGRDGTAIGGYQGAIYSGVTTNFLADIVADIIQERRDIYGLYQVAAPPISKYDLLCLIRRVFQLDIEIKEVEGLVCDRSMCGDRFWKATGFECPTWPQLISALYYDTTPYPAWRTELYEPVSKAF